jgi:uncharacterized protein (DUF58 family)
VLTRRGRLTLGLGVAAYLVAWAFGARAAYPAAVGLVLAPLGAWAWVRLLDRPLQLLRRAGGSHPLEGADLALDFEAVPEGRIVPASLVLTDRIARLGSLEVVLRKTGRTLRGRLVLPRLPRGRYAGEGTNALLEDPFGLARVEVPLEAGGAILVYPRLVELEGLFSESGTRAHAGRRLLLRRPAGFDIHSVREYEQGESLRRVHWPTTARRGQLMVRELEDSPRDEVAVLLDATEGTVAGTPPDSSFDLQVRAAGSILRAHARRGRRAVLVVSSHAGGAHRLGGADDDWHRALELLAEAEPSGRTPAAALLESEASPAARALELAVVTARLSPELVERLAQRAFARHPVSVVYVDAVSFASVPRHEPEPALLRLQAAGIPVAVLRRGDNLAARLGAVRGEAVGS